MDNNMNINAQASIIVSKDNAIVDKTDIMAKYDGNKLEVVGENRGKIILMQLSNDEIMDILAIPSSNLGLKERLKMDFRSRKKKHTKHKRRKKEKKTKKRSSSIRKSRSKHKKQPTVTTLIGEL
jgi:predicted regulator of Ras-like GTPase activity (Roadblock/LC7/MglB family)